MENLFDVDVIVYLLLVVAVLYIKYRVSIEIRDTCSLCQNNVNKPKRQGLYKIKFFLSLLTHAGIAMAVYHLIVK